MGIELRPRQVQWHHIPFHPSLASLGYQHIGQRGNLLHSPRLSAQLRSDHAAGIPWRAERQSVYELPPEHELLARAILALRKGLRDEEKVGLGAELDPRTRTAVLRSTSYLKGACTNDLAAMDVVWTGEHRYRGLEFILRDGVIPRLEDSRCSNHLGAGTLAVSADGYVLAGLQGHGNSYDQGALICSGSGSMDWEDVERGGWDILEAAAQTTTRECIEELGVPSGVEVETRVVGFCRNLDRGGKPELLCASYIPLSARELFGSSERDALLPVPLTTARALEPQLRSLADAHELSTWPMLYLLAELAAPALIELYTRRGR